MTRIRCLIIQLAPMGDTIQSLMALRAAKKLYPHLEIHLVVRGTFAAAARQVGWIDGLHELPTQELLEPILSGKITEKEGVPALARWVAPLVERRWDLVVNWSFSEASSYLASLLPARVKLGYTRKRDLSFLGADGWSHYMKAIVQAREPQNIHLTDILTTQLLTALQIHWGDPSDVGNAAVTSKDFFDLALGQDEEARSWESVWSRSSRKWIAVHLGRDRHLNAPAWPVERWADFISKVLQRNAEIHIVLLGDDQSAAEASSIMSCLREGDIDTNRVLSLVGQADFSLTASIIGQCQWLVGSSLEAVQLASVLGTRVLELGIGPRNRDETGPYGNSHYVVASRFECPACEKMTQDIPHHCARAIQPEVLFSVWSYAHGEWLHRRQSSIEKHFKSLGMESLVATVDVLRSRIRHTDAGGGVVYERLVKRPITPKEWSAQVTGHIARAWYCGWLPPVGQELSRTDFSPELVQSLRYLEESSELLEKVCSEAQRTAKALAERSARLPSDKLISVKSREELNAFGKKITELDRLIDRLGNADPLLRPLANMSKVLQHHAAGSQLKEISQHSAFAYEQLTDGVKILREWIEHSLQLTRPRIVKSPQLVPPQQK